MSARRRTTRLALAVVLAGPVVGVLAGVVWQWWWTPPAGVAVDGEFVFTSAGLAEGFSGTGLYVVVAAVAGLLLGLGASLRADGREVVVLLALLLSSAAAAAVMGVVGSALGPRDADARAARLDDYTALVGDLRVEGSAPWLTLPTAAVLAAAGVFLLLTRRQHHPVGGDRYPAASTHDHGGTP